MSYVAIARKWRPRTFEEIAGQTHVTRTLANAIKLDRIHHAFLFTGARGVGKTTAARTLARCLNCEQDGPRPDPCGECGCCQAILAGNSPDVIEIDGASNNSVEDVRDLRESVRYMPQRGRFKVYIVDEVHMLSRGAFNALLKTLEEPPAHVVFIFATTEPQKIPDTILSRVQRFDFKRIPQQVVVDYLSKICAAEGVKIPEDGLRLIARAGEGSMRDSQSLLDQVISFAGDDATTEQVAEILGLVDRKLLYEMLEGMVRGQADRCLSAIDQVYGYGYDLSEFTAELLELLRNATLVTLSQQSHRWLDVPGEEVERLTGLAKDVPPEVFVRSFDVMLDVHEQVARAPRPRLVLEMAVARLVSIRPARPLDQVVRQLHDLERRMRQGGAAARPRDHRSGGRSGAPGGGRDDADPEPGRRGPPQGGGDQGGNHGGPPPRGTPMASSHGGASHGGLALVRDSAPAGVTRAAPSAEVRRSAPPLREVPPPLDDELPTAGHASLPPESDPAPLGRSRPDDRSFDDRGFDDRSFDDRGFDDGGFDDPGLGDSGLDGADDRPPLLAPGATEEHRFRAFTQWLAHGGMEWDLWAQDAVLLSVEPPVLRVGFRHEFQERQAARKAHSKRIKRGVEDCFPGCSAVSVEPAGPGAGSQSQREADRAAYEARVAELERDMAVHPLIAALRDRLGAEVTGVVPDTVVRAPPPPLLDDEGAEDDGLSADPLAHDAADAGEEEP
ncbi:MAG: DNA polymerase III subunit gamma/tau [Alphaproteobacteria bacterium]|nr:DNA polymerase III subunit gamma/tau [Alphaproteobacteria bacterium]